MKKPTLTELTEYWGEIPAEQKKFGNKALVDAFGIVLLKCNSQLENDIEMSAVSARDEKWIKLATLTLAGWFLDNGYFEKGSLSSSFGGKSVSMAFETDQSIVHTFFEYLEKTIYFTSYEIVNIYDEAETTDTGDGGTTTPPTTTGDAIFKTGQKTSEVSLNGTSSEIYTTDKIDTKLSAKANLTDLDAKANVIDLTNETSARVQGDIDAVATSEQYTRDLLKDQITPLYDLALTGEAISSQIIKNWDAIVLADAKAYTDIEITNRTNADASLQASINLKADITTTDNLQTQITANTNNVASKASLEYVNTQDGPLTSLTTLSKNNLVSAINEINDKIGGPTGSSNEYLLYDHTFTANLQVGDPIDITAYVKVFMVVMPTSTQTSMTTNLFAIKQNGIYLAEGGFKPLATGGNITCTGSASTITLGQGNNQTVFFRVLVFGVNPNAPTAP